MDSTQEVTAWNIDIKNYIKDFSYDAGLPLVILIICCVLLWLCIGKKIVKILITFSTILFGLFCFRETPELLSKPLTYWNKQILTDQENSDLVISANIPECIHEAKAIIILGSGIYQKNLPTVNAQLRLLGLTQLLNIIENKNIRTIQLPIVITGGYTNKFIAQSEAQAMKVFFNYLYSKTSKIKIITENKSKNTYQNSAYAKVIFEENKLPKVAVLITNDFHMLRAKKTFEAQGFKICPVPVMSSEIYGSGVFNFNNALNSVSLLNEYIGIMGYVWKGWLKI